MKTKLYSSQLKKQRWQKLGIATALIVFIGGGFLFGTIKMIDATKIETHCQQWAKPDCNKKGQEKQPCPQPNDPNRCTRRNKDNQKMKEFMTCQL